MHLASFYITDPQRIYKSPLKALYKSASSEPAHTSTWKPQCITQCYVLCKTICLLRCPSPMKFKVLKHQLLPDFTISCRIFIYVNSIFELLQRMDVSDVSDVSEVHVA
jgi:hypothetical protein